MRNAFQRQFIDQLGDVDPTLTPLGVNVATAAPKRRRKRKHHAKGETKLAAGATAPDAPESAELGDGEADDAPDDDDAADDAPESGEPQGDPAARDGEASS